MCCCLSSCLPLGTAHNKHTRTQNVVIAAMHFKQCTQYFPIPFATIHLILCVLCIYKMFTYYVQVQSIFSCTASLLPHAKYFPLREASFTTLLLCIEPCFFCERVGKTENLITNKKNNNIEHPTETQIYTLYTILHIIRSSK